MTIIQNRLRETRIDAVVENNCAAFLTSDTNEQKFAELKAYFVAHDCLEVFGQDSLEQAGPTGDEIFDQIADDAHNLEAILTAAVSEYKVRDPRATDAEQAQNVAEVAYEAWQDSELTKIHRSAVKVPAMTEAQIWDAYADHPAKRTAALIMNGLPTFTA